MTSGVTRVGAGRMAALLAAGCMVSGCAQKAPVGSFADLPGRIDSGRTVYVVDTEGKEVRAPLRELSESAVTLSGANAGAPIPAERVSVLGTYGDPVWNGLGIGLGIGTAMALFADRREVPCPDGTDSPACYDAEVGSRLAAVALLGAVGAGVDALIRRRNPVYVAPGAAGSPRLVISPAVSPRRAGVFLVFSF